MKKAFHSFVIGRLLIFALWGYIFLLSQNLFSTENLAPKSVANSVFTFQPFIETVYELHEMLIGDYDVKLLQKLYFSEQDQNFDRIGMYFNRYREIYDRDPFSPELDSLKVEIAFLTDFLHKNNLIKDYVSKLSKNSNVSNELYAVMTELVKKNSFEAHEKIKFENFIFDIISSDILKNNINAAEIAATILKNEPDAANDYILRIRYLLENGLPGIKALVEAGIDPKLQVKKFNSIIKEVKERTNLVYQNKIMPDVLLDYQIENCIKTKNWVFLFLFINNAENLSKEVVDSFIGMGEEVVKPLCDFLQNNTLRKGFKINGEELENCMFEIISGIGGPKALEVIASSLKTCEDTSAKSKIQYLLNMGLPGIKALMKALPDDPRSIKFGLMLVEVANLVDLKNVSSNVASIFSKIKELINEHKNNWVLVALLINEAPLSKEIINSFIEMGEEVVEPLCDILENSFLNDDPTGVKKFHLKNSIIEILSGIGSPKAAKDIVNFLKQYDIPDQSFVETKIEALFNMGIPGIKALIEAGFDNLKLLEVYKTSIKKAIINEVEKRSGDSYLFQTRWLSMVEQAIKEKNWVFIVLFLKDYSSYRRWVEELGEQKDEETVNALIKLLDNNPYSGPEQINFELLVIKILGKIGSSKAADAVVSNFVRGADIYLDAKIKSLLNMGRPGIEALMNQNLSELQLNAFINVVIKSQVTESPKEMFEKKNVLKNAFNRKDTEQILLLLGLIDETAILRMNKINNQKIQEIREKLSDLEKLYNKIPSEVRSKIPEANEWIYFKRKIAVLAPENIEDIKKSEQELAKWNVLFFNIYIAVRKFIQNDHYLNFDLDGKDLLNNNDIKQKYRKLVKDYHSDTWEAKGVNAYIAEFIIKIINNSKEIFDNTNVMKKISDLSKSRGVPDAFKFIYGKNIYEIFNVKPGCTFEELSTALFNIGNRKSLSLQQNEEFTFIFQQAKKILLNPVANELYEKTYKDFAPRIDEKIEMPVIHPDANNLYKKYGFKTYPSSYEIREVFEVILENKEILLKQYKITKQQIIEDYKTLDNNKSRKAHDLKNRITSTRPSEMPSSNKTTTSV